MENINNQLNYYVPGSHSIGFAAINSPFFRDLYIACNDFYEPQTYVVENELELYNLRNGNY